MWYAGVNCSRLPVRAVHTVLHVHWLLMSNVLSLPSTRLSVACQPRWASTEVIVLQRSRSRSLLPKHGAQIFAGQPRRIFRLFLPSRFWYRVSTSFQKLSRNLPVQTCSMQTDRRINLWLSIIQRPCTNYVLTNRTDSDHSSCLGPLEKVGSSSWMQMQMQKSIDLTPQ